MFSARHQSPEGLSYIEVDKILTQLSDQTSLYLEILLIQIRIKLNQDVEQTPGLSGAAVPSRFEFCS